MLGGLTCLVECIYSYTHMVRRVVVLGSAGAAIEEVKFFTFLVSC